MRFITSHLAQKRRNADFQVCGIAGFEACVDGVRPAGLETGDTAGLETCATRRRRSQRGFTLMEVLAALLFMAIVIPVAVQGVRIASMAGEVGLRKKAAARIGQSVLDEMRANTQNQSAVTAGQVQEGSVNYQYSIRTETWPEDAMRLATVDVTFAVQGKNYDVRLSTLLAQQ